MPAIQFLPFLEIKKEFGFADVVYWPFWRLKSRRIREASDLTYLEWYFNKWKNPISLRRLNVTIASLAGKLLGPFTKEEQERIRTASNILFLLSVDSINEIYPLSSDNFILYDLNFIGEEHKLALSMGSYIREDLMLSSQVAKRINFYKPYFVPQHCSRDHSWISDRQYFRAIQRAYCREYNEDWFVRIRRSLNSFISSYSNVHSIDYFERIVLLVTAIEILLDVDTSGSNRFVSAMESTIGFGNRACQSSHTLANINRKIRTFSGALYSKRSKYVHGELLTEGDVHHRIFGEYFKTGVILYYELIKSLLEKNNYLRRSLYQKAFEYNFKLFRHEHNGQEIEDR